MKPRMITTRNNKKFAILTGIGIVVYAYSVFAQCIYNERHSNDCNDTSSCDYTTPKTHSCDVTPGLMTAFSAPSKPATTNYNIQVRWMYNGHCNGTECVGGTQGPSHYETQISQWCDLCGG